MQTLHTGPRDLRGNAWLRHSHLDSGALGSIRGEELADGRVAVGAVLDIGSAGSCGRRSGEEELRAARRKTVRVSGRSKHRLNALAQR